MINKLKLWLVAAVLLIIWSLQSCSTLEKRIAKAKVVAYENPLSFSEFCTNNFPVRETFIKGKETIRIDTVTVKGDSIKCPDVIDQKGNIVSNKVKCPDAVYYPKYIDRVDTVKFEVTSKLSTLQRKYNELNTKYVKSEEDLLEAEKTAKDRIWWIAGLAFILAGSIALHIRRIVLGSR